MKNKKILARVFALVMCLAFAVALALPCFADEPTTPEVQNVVNVKHFTDVSELFHFLVDHQQDFLSLSIGVPILDGQLAYSTFSDMVFTYNTSDVDGIVFTSLFTPDWSSSTLYAQFNSVYITESSVNALMTPADLFIHNNTFDYTGNDGVVLTTDLVAALGADISVCYLSPYFPPDQPTRSGMFGTLFNILSDAIFGKNAVLDSTQEFTLTLISTIMTYATVLVPVIAVVAICVALFKRW